MKQLQEISADPLTALGGVDVKKGKQFQHYIDMIDINSWNGEDTIIL